MLNLQIGRIKRLPLRPDVGWAGGAVRMPVWYDDGPPEEPYRP